MEKIELQPLTEHEKYITEKNHPLIYAFLHRCGYSVDEYYGIAAEGYVKGVQAHCRKPERKGRHTLAFICWQYMRAELRNYFKIQKAQKRIPVENIISLDTEHSYEFAGNSSPEIDLLEIELTKQLMENLSIKQRRITELKLIGYENKEIYHHLNISRTTYYRELQRIRVELEKVIS